MGTDLEHTMMFKKPAVIVRAQQPAQYLTGGPRDRYPLMARALADQRRGRIAIEWPEPRWDQQSGQYLLKVRRLKAPAPAWRKPVIGLGAGAAVLTGLSALAWHALTALSAGSLVLLILAVLSVFTVWVSRRHRTDVTVTTATTVRVRR